jgi:PAS domain S-box
LITHLDLVQTLIDALIDAVWLIDPQNQRLLAVNRASEELLGLERTALVGRPVIELVCTPEDLFFWEEVAAGGGHEPLSSETLLKRHDGSLVQVLRRVTRISIPDGPDVYLICLSDQTQRRAVEDELERLIAELRATLESSMDGILVTDLAGSIRSFNRRFAELWNLAPDLLTERTTPRSTPGAGRGARC